MRKVVPSEEFEQEQLVRWLEANSYKFSAIVSGMYTPSHATRAKNKRLGLRPGLPDLLIVLKCHKLMFLEMKRSTGGRLSPAQRNWLKVLEKCGAISSVCAGHEVAIEAIQEAEANELY